MCECVCFEMFLEFSIGNTVTAHQPRFSSILRYGSAGLCGISPPQWTTASYVFLDKEASSFSPVRSEDKAAAGGFYWSY